VTTRDVCVSNSDSNTARALSVQVTVRGGVFNNTVGNCIGACASKSYSAAGVEFAQECCTHFTSYRRTSLL
jgi:hypothetical protein